MKVGRRKINRENKTRHVSYNLQTYMPNMLAKKTRRYNKV